MYIYHGIINALSAHMIHINLNMIFYTHIEHSTTKTISHKVIIIIYKKKKMDWSNWTLMSCPWYRVTLGRTEVRKQIGERQKKEKKKDIDFFLLREREQ